MESLVKFRLFAVRIALALTLLGALACHALFGRPASIGMLLGGLAGVLVFWVTARRMEKVARQGADMILSVPVTWRILGLLVYLLVLVRAYTLDKEGLSGLIAAAVGLFMIRIAAMVLGVTGLDLPEVEE